jgi:hypothetical protein
MSQSIPIPELQQSPLDVATLCQLFGDVRRCAQLVEVLPKYAPGFIAPDATMTPEDGLNGLLQGRLRGLQLRYLYQGSLWWDTLLVVAPGSFRIVRIRHEAALH